MALGGGSFNAQNKDLPGAYVNFVSAASSNAQLSERGIVTMPLELDWGVEDGIFEVSGEEFSKNSAKIFGYSYEHEKLKGLRDLFLGARTLYAYRLNGGGKKAANEFATANYAGIRGNDIKISIQANADDNELFDVLTVFDAVVVDSQTAACAAYLKNNDYVTFHAEAELKTTSAMPLTGGENGTTDGKAYQTYADLIEAYSFNVMGIVTTDETIKRMFVSFNKRMRDEMGIKFQLVLYDCAADYMGLINVKNPALEANEASLVYWVTGAQAGCEVNKSCQNKKYDGEHSIDVKRTQSQLIDSLKAGEFVLHKVNEDVRVLDDINSMVTTNENCGEIFKDNQTIRVIDQLGNDDATLFNEKYLGVVPNDESGRISLWSDLVKIRERLQSIGAIENFSDDDVTIEQGETKKSVVVTSAIEVVNTMSKLYATVTIA